MTLTAMLLAGGSSRRMGMNKATLTFEGEPFWQRQLRVLRELQPAVLQVSARTRPPWCPPEIEVVLDELPSCGPLGGVAAGLRRLRTSHLLVLAIDLPRMTPEHLRKLRSLASPGCGVIPFHNGYIEPLCAIYPAEAAAIAQEALQGNDVSLQHFVRTLLTQSRVQKHFLALEEQLLYLNLNSPSDLQASEARGPRPPQDCG
jgi:molybdenum cofactor guanylyltransferase